MSKLAGNEHDNVSIYELEM